METEVINEVRTGNDRMTVNVNCTNNCDGGSTGTGNGNGEKVEICHNGQTLEVAPAALPAHYGHGDTLGPCETVKVETDKKPKTTKKKK